jgi:hypothetical protein
LVDLNRLLDMARRTESESQAPGWSRFLSETEFRGMPASGEGFAAELNGDHLRVVTPDASEYLFAMADRDSCSALGSSSEEHESAEGEIHIARTEREQPIDRGSVDGRRLVTDLPARRQPLAKPQIAVVRSIANDGHVCLSIGEKTIDDLMYAAGIEHTKEPPYPEGRMRADFQVGSSLVEYFGLVGDEVYDAKIDLKRGLAAKHGRALIEVYPADLADATALAARLSAAAKGRVA